LGSTGYATGCGASKIARNRHILHVLA
jgi:hypothetical protein